MPERKQPLKNNELQGYLARYLVRVEEGSRLLPIRKLAAQYGTSTGSISEALTELENLGALKRERRGHLGSFLVERSLSKLWTIAETDPLVVAFPLPSGPRLEGLATALKMVLTKAGMDVYFIYIRGSHTRLKAMEEDRCHAAIMSAFAADELYGDEENIAVRLAPGSYVSAHCVFYRRHDKSEKRKLRVAIDRDSHDIERLTELEFADQDVQFVPITYVQIPRHLREGHVDAAVWNLDDMSMHLGDQIAHRPLSEKVRDAVGERTTAAAIVTRPDGDTTRPVFDGILDVQRIGEIQEKVMSGEIVPEY